MEVQYQQLIEAERCEILAAASTGSSGARIGRELRRNLWRKRGHAVP